MHSSILIMVTPWHISLPEAERKFPCYGNFLYASPPPPPPSLCPSGPPLMAKPQYPPWPDPGFSSWPHWLGWEPLACISRKYLILLANDCFPLCDFAFRTSVSSLPSFRTSQTVWHYWINTTSSVSGELVRSPHSILKSTQYFAEFETKILLRFYLRFCISITIQFLGPKCLWLRAY